MLIGTGKMVFFLSLSMLIKRVPELQSRVPSDNEEVVVVVIVNKMLMGCDNILMNNYAF